MAGGGRSSAETAAGRDAVSRILIADDEPSVREVLATLLLDEGHTVQQARDGRVALEMITEELPDLVITDVMMPGLDGWALLASVRARTATLPVIIISAIERREAKQREILVADHTVFLRKPFDIEALLTTVEHLTGSRPTREDADRHGAGVGWL